MKTYVDLMNAVTMLARTASDLSRVDGYVVTSPAWRMVYHAQQYLEQQASIALRGE